MLVTIIADYLQISVNSANHFMTLLSQEGNWQKEQLWKGERYSLSNVKTQADVIAFLQAIGQSQWFKGHDYSKLPDNQTEGLSELYFSLFEKIGLTQEVRYGTLNPSPDYSVVLGATEPTVRTRIKSLEQDLVAGITPKEHVVFGLGCNRLLGISAPQSEETSKRQLLDKHQEPTEMNMVKLLMEECLDKLGAQHCHLETMLYRSVNTTSTAKTREEDHCVKTEDTALSLKSAIEQQVKKRAPTYVAVYSNQPFVLRQQRDVQMKLGDGYIVVGVGSAFTRTDATENRKSISELFAELAKLIHIYYTPAYLKRFEVALTPIEMDEINQLSQGKSQSNMAPEEDCPSLTGPL